MVHEFGIAACEIPAHTGPHAGSEILRVNGVAPLIPETHTVRGQPAGEPPYLTPAGITGKSEIRATASADAEVIGGIDPGTVLRNSGCMEIDGVRWCAVSNIDGDLSGWARAAALETAGPSLRAGQGVFDAAGTVACALGAHTPMTGCTFGAARDSSGTATVVVTKPDGIDRALFFENETFQGSDTSQAGGGFEVSATREGDLFLIRVDDEHYEIPVSFVFGN